MHVTICDSRFEGDCPTCDLAWETTPRPTKKGMLLRTAHWTVERRTAPDGGTLVVRPLRRLTGPHDLNAPETAELGPLLGRVTADEECGRAYVCL